jgi:hypothetical protein
MVTPPRDLPTDLTDRFDLWAGGIPYELSFWTNWAKTRGGGWPEEFSARMNPETPLVPWLAERAKTDKVWDYENLNAFIHNPKGYASNTKMAYAGDKNDSRRGDLIAYLRSISPKAPPLPTP